jgi:hypothetical protein
MSMQSEENTLENSWILLERSAIGKSFREAVIGGTAVAMADRQLAGLRSALSRRTPHTSGTPPLGIEQGETKSLRERLGDFARQLRVPREFAEIPVYSDLNTCIGSRRDARHAGMRHANAATARSVTATAA